MQILSKMKLKLKTYSLPFLFFLFIVWLIVQADMDQTNIIIDVGHRVPHGDKIGHFLIFGIFALLINMALRFKRINIYTRRFHLGSVLVFLLALCEEFSQLAFETRTFDVIDMAFDLFGIGILSSISFRKYLVLKFRSLTDYLSKKLLVE